MMPTLQLRRTSLFWFQGAWELGRVFEFLAASCFVFVCVCFPTPKVGDYFVFESHKWVRFSWFFFSFCVCVCVCVCVLFFLQNFRFPYHISRVRLIFVFFLSRRLVKFLAFFHFCLFLFCFVLFFLIPIWNFTNTFIQDCKIIWEFQIRGGGTSLLRPLWRSWRYLKAYPLMSIESAFKILKNWFFFLFQKPSSKKHNSQKELGWNHSSMKWEQFLQKVSDTRLNSTQ